MAWTKATSAVWAMAFPAAAPTVELTAFATVLAAPAELAAAAWALTGSWWMTGEELMAARYDAFNRLPMTATPSAPPTSPCGVVDGGAHTRLFGRDRSHDRVGGRRHGQAHPDPEQDDAGEDERVPTGKARSQAGPGQQAEGEGDDDDAAGHDELGPDPADQGGAGGSGDHERRGDGCDPQTGLQGVVAEDVLEIEGQEEQRAEQGEEDQCHRGGRGRKPRVGEEADVQDPMVGV
jgi:hypothetical protein